MKFKAAMMVQPGVFQFPVSKEQGPSIAASYSFYYYRRHPKQLEASSNKHDDDSLFFECQCLKKNPGFQILCPSP